MMAESRAGDPIAPLVSFGRLLRARGLPVGTGRIVTFCRAAAALRPLDRDNLYLAARASMIGRHEDFEAFDRAFDEWFRTLGPKLPEIELELPLPMRNDIDWGEPPTDLEIRVASIAATWSDAGDEEPE